MSRPSRLIIAAKAIREIGIHQLWLYGLYQLGLRSGYYRRLTPPRKPLPIISRKNFGDFPSLITIPNPEVLADVLGDNAAALFAEANELDKNKFRLFGGPPKELSFIVPLPLEHWTQIAVNPEKVGDQDIKFTWEPARFTWAYTLVRSYVLSGDETYVETFWRGCEAFSDMNLTNMGPNWVSAQEVAIRLISFCFAHQVFNSAAASTPERSALLRATILDHAERIPPTLAYARAQNNNHLLIEAAGLITAANYLPQHPKADSWRAIGRNWFNQALGKQISGEGTYVQQSVNYHRAMLQAALWVYAIDNSISEDNIQKLAAATKWLSSMVDAETGRAPNLGHNDGSYIQPLSSCSYHDFRPVLQAASQAFIGELIFPAGPWDEYPLWLGQELPNQDRAPDSEQMERPATEIQDFTKSHVVLRNRHNNSWGLLRTAKFSDRPAHADQLHLDLWWLGNNLAQDAGTYLYNEDAPWNNSLAQTAIHNTITINNQDQMTQAGRFLWLDWADAEITSINQTNDGNGVRLTAHHDGYHNLDVTHQRTVVTGSDGRWIIEDLLQSRKSAKPEQANAFDDRNPGKSRAYQASLNWLLPDWIWEIEHAQDQNLATLRLRSPKDWLEIDIATEPATRGKKEDQTGGIRIYRAGEPVYGSDTGNPIKGWISPTYDYKVPALSLEVWIESRLPIRFRTEWRLPNLSEQ